MPHAVNLSRWLERLGFKRNDEPEYIHAIQPVALVRDETSLAPPDVGDLYACGANRSGVAGEVGCYQWVARRDTLARVTVGAAATGAMRYHVVAIGAEMALNNVINPTVMPLSDTSRPVAGTPVVGTQTLAVVGAAFPVSDPAIIALANVQIGIDIMVRAGFVLEVATSAIAGVAYFDSILQEYPEARLA